MQFLGYLKLIILQRRKKKKLYRFPVSVICHINKTHNNLFLTLTKLDGTVLLQLSGGKIGKKGPKRDTPNTAELLGRRFGELFHSMGYKRCITKINGSFDGFVRSAVRGLVSRRVRMMQIQHVKGVSHNGIRSRKQRHK